MRGKIETAHNSVPQNDDFLSPILIFLFVLARTFYCPAQLFLGVDWQWWFSSLFEIIHRKILAQIDLLCFFKNYLFTYLTTKNRFALIFFLLSSVFGSFLLMTVSDNGVKISDFLFSKKKRKFLLMVQHLSLFISFPTKHHSDHAYSIFVFLPNMSREWQTYISRDLERDFFASELCGQIILSHCTVC